jgi:hypothetical protein
MTDFDEVGVGVGFAPCCCVVTGLDGVGVGVGFVICEFGTPGFNGVGVVAGFVFCRCKSICGFAAPDFCGSAISGISHFVDGLILSRANDKIVIEKTSLVFIFDRFPLDAGDP